MRAPTPYPQPPVVSHPDLGRGTRPSQATTASALPTGPTLGQLGPSGSAAAGRGGGRAAGAAPRREHLLDLPLHLLQVHELAVHRREADVGHLVDIAQTVHHHLPDLAARDLDTAAPAQAG